MKRAAVVVSSLIAACHSADSGPPADPAPAVAAHAAPRAPAPDFSLGSGLVMQRPIRDGRVTIIPIVATASTPVTPDYLPLDEGMRTHQVTVRGIRDDYSIVRVHNGSTRPVLAMSGELLLGGDQDHALAESRVILPGETAVLQADCVENGRNAGPLRFRTGHAMVDLHLRRTIQFGGQGPVWREIDKTNTRLGLSPATHTYRLAAEQQDASDAAARRAAIAAQLDRPGVVGVAVAYGGDVVAIDRFTTQAAFRAHEDELLGSALAGDDGLPHEGTPTPAAVRDLAGRVAAVRTTDASFEALADLKP